jgi:hypothetical protein
MFRSFSSSVDVLRQSRNSSLAQKNSICFGSRIKTIRIYGNALEESCTQY